jgi:hypothetical protein
LIDTTEERGGVKERREREGGREREGQSEREREREVSNTIRAQRKEILNVLSVAKVPVPLTAYRQIKLEKYKKKFESTEIKLFP